MKTCKKCGFEKNLSEFSKNKRKTDGFDPWCKTCASESCKKWRLKTKHDGRIVDEKYCYNCKNIKPASEFYKDKAIIDGLANRCKDCHKEYVKAHPEINRNYNDRMKKSVKPITDGRVCGNCGEYKTSDNFYKTYYTKDGLYSHCKICQEESNKKWAENNIERRKKTSNAYYKNKRINDPVFRLRVNTSLAVRMSVLNYSSCFCSDHFKSFAKDLFDHLPYTPDQLKEHIESLWDPWMNWDNYGNYDKTKLTWQIDHIIPQSKLPFESFDDPNFQKCWALENIRPLETIENIKKSNKIISSLLKEKELKDQDIEKYTKEEVLIDAA
jgi:hypothetical protein